MIIPNLITTSWPFHQWSSCAQAAGGRGESRSDCATSGCHWALEVLLVMVMMIIAMTMTLRRMLTLMITWISGRRFYLCCWTLEPPNPPFLFTQLSFTRFFLFTKIQNLKFPFKSTNPHCWIAGMCSLAFRDFCLSRRCCRSHRWHWTWFGRLLYQVFKYKKKWNIHAHDTGPDNYCVRCLTITGFKHNIWSFRNLTRLLYPAKEDKVEDDADGNKEEVEVELDRQLEELYVVFGFRSISVLRYLTDHTGVLSLGVLARCAFCLLWDTICPFLMGCSLKNSHKLFKSSQRSVCHQC